MTRSMLFAALAVFGQALTFASGTALAQTPLNLFWSDARQDNFSTGTAAGESAALAAGYRFVRTEGYLFPSTQSGTVPLNVYWSGQRGDNYSTATAAGADAARAAGYVFVRIEGYVYPTQQPNTVPLKAYWNAAYGDNITTSTAAGEASAIAAGYVFVRVEGYVAERPPSLTISLDTDLGNGHFMTTTGVMLNSGRIEAITRTQSVTWFGGFTGGVQIFFEDANGFTIGASQVQAFGVDGRAFGRSDRTDFWAEDIDPSVAARTVAIHVMHFWYPRYQFFTNLVNYAVAVGRPLVDLIKDIRAGGGSAN